MNNYQIKIITNIDAPFIEQWNELWNIAENATIFNSFQWFLTCKETYRIKNLEIHACYKDGKLVAVLPLSTYRRFGIKVTGSIGNNFLYNTTFLMEKYDNKLFKYFMGSIIAKRNLYITRIDSTAAGILHKIFPEIFFSLMAAGPYLNIDKDPLRFISKSTFNNTKKIINKNLGLINFKAYDNKDNLEDMLETIFRIEQNSSKKLNSKDLFSKEENKDFYRNLVRYCDQFIQIHFLYYQGTPIVYSFGFKYNKTAIGYQTSYLNEYKKLSPGKIMIVKLLESLKGSSVEKLDFGAGLSTFKQEFTPDYYLLYDLYFSKNIFVMIWWNIINLVRRAKKIIFAEKFTRDPEFLFKTLK